MTTLRERDSFTKGTMSATTYTRGFRYYILFGAFRNEGKHCETT